MNLLLSCLLGVFALSTPVFAEQAFPVEPMGWGIDTAGSASAADGECRAALVALLREANVGILRERAPNPAMAGLSAESFRILSFCDLGPLSVEQRGNVLPENLLVVYEAAKRMQRTHGDYVDAWETVNEADIGYCRDLPDRLVAFHKAVYLGIKAGAAEASSRGTPLVLMGGLALPPGPWLDRATRNGLLDYTDAYNFHFYGYAGDLAGVLRAHEAFLRDRAGLRGASGTFPIWITECGVNAVDPSDFLNPERRNLQADFTVETAKQALADSTVAVFMPFVLLNKDDPHALLLAPDRPLPAWNAFASYARANPFPRRRLSVPNEDPYPVVVQWLPDLNTAIPEKIAGCYRFWERNPMRGRLRVYNLGARPVRGRLGAERLGNVECEPDETAADPYFRPDPESGGRWSSPEFELSPQSCRDFTLGLRPTTDGYFREFWELRFVGSNGGGSSAYFGLEARPKEEQFVERPLVYLPSDGGIDAALEPGLSCESSRSGGWIGYNGLRVDASGDGLELSVGKTNRDPLRPVFALAGLGGLPQSGFLHVRLDKPFDASFRLRVDLVDNLGQRFSIWENCGASYFGPGNELWLNLADFGVYFWGPCSDKPILRPERVTQIRIRCYFGRENEPRKLRLSLLEKAD